MNKILMKKALACMLALTMAAVSSGCGSNDEKTESKADTSSEVSQADMNASEAEESSSEAEESSSEDSSEAEETDPLLAYYDLMAAEDSLLFGGYGIADGIIYYCTYNKEDRFGQPSMYYNIRTLDIESGEDKELLFCESAGEPGFLYFNGCIYLYRYVRDDFSSYASTAHTRIEKYDTEGNLIAEYTCNDSDFDYRIIGIAANGAVVINNNYLTPDFKELKPFPESPDGSGSLAQYNVAGNKLYMQYNNDKTLYCYDLETEGMTSIDNSVLYSEGNESSARISGTYARGRYLQITIDHGRGEDQDYLIIDSETNEIIARPQSPALSSLYHDSDRSVGLVNDRYVYLQYPADGSAPVRYYTSPKLTNLMPKYEAQLFDHGRYWLGYDLDSDNKDSYLYVDLEADKPEKIYFYDTADGLISENAPVRPKGTKVPKNYEGMSFRVVSLMSGMAQAVSFESSSKVYPVYTFNHGRFTVEWFNKNGTPASDNSHERSIFEKYELTYEFTETDDGVYFTSNWDDVEKQYCEDIGFNGSDGTMVFDYTSDIDSWLIFDPAFFSGDDEIYAGNFYIILTPVEK